MISVFGYNLELVLDYPSEKQNYTFSTILYDNLINILDNESYSEEQVFSIKAKPNKAFIELCKKLLTEPHYNKARVRILAQFESEQACTEGFKKLARKFKKRETAGGLVENGEGAFLAIFSRGRWSLPKGGIEPDESAQEAAIREVEEETGLLLPTMIGSLPKSFHVYPHKGRDILKTTHWFLMHVEGVPHLVGQAEEGIEEVRWFKPADWVAEAPETYPQTKAYLQHYFSQQLVGE
ncbi:MAG: NUDIX hydrolase [Bacteroidia bacterium]